jgi:hypothetical protein
MVCPVFLAGLPFWASWARRSMIRKSGDGFPKGHAQTTNEIMTDST